MNRAQIAVQMPLNERGERRFCCADIRAPQAHRAVEELRIELHSAHVFDDTGIDACSKESVLLMSITSTDERTCTEERTCVEDARMNRPLHATAVVLAIGVAVRPATAMGAQGCPAYTVEVIEAPPCPHGKEPLTIGLEIGADGTVVGHYAVCFSGNDKAFIAHTDGTFTTIPTVPGFVSMQAWDINDDGAVVGWMETSTGTYRGFLAVDGVATELSTPDGFAGSKAQAIGNSGIIVGASFAPSAPEATVWTDGVPSQLALPLGPNSDARAVNDRGQVAGWMGSGSTVSSASAFVLDLPTGRVTDLGHLPDGTGAAYGINNIGEVVGSGVMPDPGGSGLTSRAIRWSDGRMLILGVLPGFGLSAAQDINDSSEIVGQCWNIPPNGNSEAAFIWRDGVMTALNDLIPPELGIEIKIAYAIDDEGRITGKARDSRGDVVAVRLTPVPSVPGDFNRDAVVNGADLAILLGAWGLPGPADIDESGAVDGADLAVVLGNWTP